MDEIIGSLLVASGITLFSWSVLEYRRPQPPLWTHKENYAICFSVGVTTLFSLGTAAYINGFTQEAHALPGAVEWTAIAIIYGGVAIFLSLLSRWWKQVRNEVPLAVFGPENPVRADAANDAGVAMETAPPGIRPRAA